MKIHLNPKDKSKVCNISLNDVSLLEEKTPLDNFVSEIKGNLPIEYGSLGDLISVKLKKDTLIFTLQQDIVEQNLFCKNLESTQDLGKDLIIFLFGPSGGFNNIAKDIMEEHYNITFDIKIGNKEKNKHYTISHEFFSKLFNDGIASHDVLVAYMNINNLAFPSIINDGHGNVLEIGRIYLSDSTLFYPITFKSGKDETIEIWRKNIIDGLYNIENPDAMTIYHAVRDNKAFTMDFLYEKTRKHNQWALSREETINLYHSIADSPQNE